MATVSVIIPCRNERAHVAVTLESLLDQDASDEILEILVADGESDDGTREVLADFAARHPKVRMIDNPERVTPAALRLLLREARGDILIRADAHARFPPDYVSTLARHLEDPTVANVGGVWETVPGADTAQARAIADCLNSPFGVGRSYRTLGGRRPIEVETVPYGAWRRDHFEKYGPFDPRFTRAQDLEHNLRVRRAGGRIVCLPWLRITYFARDSFAKLRRMAFQYGYWKIPVMNKHRRRFSLRQFAPPALLASLAAALAAAFVHPLWLVWPAAYLALTVVFSVPLAVRARRPQWLPLYVAAFVTMHLLYGAGYLRGIWDSIFNKKWTFADISR